MGKGYLATLMKNGRKIDTVFLDEKDHDSAWHLFFQFTNTNNYNFKKDYSIKWKKIND